MGAKYRHIQIYRRAYEKTKRTTARTSTESDQYHVSILWVRKDKKIGASCIPKVSLEYLKFNDFLAL